MSYRCNRCNSPEVEYMDWVDLNTGEPMGDDLGEFFCRSCGSPTEISYISSEEEEQPKLKQNEKTDS